MTGGMSPEDYIAHGRGDRTAALRAARTVSEQATYTALNAENTMLRGELAHLRVKLECSQLALAQAVRELGRRND
jgi:uncharacterized iron-regulated protein